MSSTLPNSNPRVRPFRESTAIHERLHPEEEATSLLARLRDDPRIGLVLFYLTFTFSLAQWVTSITILSYYWDSPCDRPIRIYLILFCIRLMATMILLLHQRFYSNTLLDPGAGSVLPGTRDKLSTLLDMYALSVFILGNYLLISSISCSSSATGLFYTTLAWLVTGYLSMAIPAIVCFSVLCCLPLLLLGTRLLPFVETAHIPFSPASEEDLIKRIIVRRVNLAPTSSSGSHIDLKPDELERGERKGSERLGIHALNGVSGSQGSLVSIQQGQRLRRAWARTHEEGGNDGIHDGLSPVPSREAQSRLLEWFTVMQGEECTICLGEYEQEERVGTLWCHHTFHHECVYEWLRTSAQCPLCKQDLQDIPELVNPSCRSSLSHVLDDSYTTTIIFD
ncbi:MAG: hypothetical protein DHS80DRAFT_32804 [Piptocephalis tieghemiana]|nr:MAG: hypothetical protein DHS80DRAFT_32804 [Piptocephalis tieghemiana]